MMITVMFVLLLCHIFCFAFPKFPDTRLVPKLRWSVQKLSRFFFHFTFSIDEVTYFFPVIFNFSFDVIATTSDLSAYYLEYKRESQFCFVWSQKTDHGSGVKRKDPDFIFP